METEKNLENDSLQAETAFIKLNGLITQIWAISNTLKLLYSFLEDKEPKIAAPSSAMEVCIAQLDYVYKKSSELLNTIADCSDIS